jgi:two-component system sensor histidine kinase BaeS
MTSTLGRRLGLGFAATGLGAALLTALLVNLAFRERFEDYLEQQRAAQEAQLVAAFSAAYESQGRWDPQALDQLAPTVAMLGAEAELRDPDGELVWSTAESRMPSMARMHRAMMGTGPLTDPTSVPVVAAGERRGTLEVALPTEQVPAADAELRRGVNQLLLAGGVGVGLLALSLGVLFARRTTRPVAELTAAARALRAGDRSRRAAVHGEDEVAELARAFNDLAETSERQDAIRQSFTADVAHELRTPLAILRSQLEAAQDGVVELTPALIESLHDETLRLGRLVADLEMMTTADAVTFSMHRVPLDLADVVFSATDALEHRFTEQGLRLQRRLHPAPICGDQVRLVQVVTNLLTNGLKFVPTGGTIDVSTGVQRISGGEWAEVTVRDNGPGIPAEELPKIFDRFYRGQRARAGGSGIGLAVVAALVQAHGGEVDVDSPPGQGAQFRVRLPTSDEWARLSGRTGACSAPDSALAGGGPWPSALLNDPRPHLRRSC